jgi:hypothetical protein
LPQTPLFCKKAISSQKPPQNLQTSSLSSFLPFGFGVDGGEVLLRRGRKEKGTEHKAEGITHSRRLFGQDQGNRFHRRSGWGSTAKTAKTAQFHRFRPCNRLFPLRPLCSTVSIASTAKTTQPLPPL